MHAKEGLLVIDGTSVKYNGTVVGTVTEGRKELATIGQYIVIFPDKKYYKVDTGTFGSMEESYAAAAGTLTFTDSTITTTGDSFNFKTGDAVVITGCTTAPENNKTVIIRNVEGKVLTFYENTFTGNRGGCGAHQAGDPLFGAHLREQLPAVGHQGQHHLWQQIRRSFQFSGVRRTERRQLLPVSYTHLRAHET